MKRLLRAVLIGAAFFMPGAASAHPGPTPCYYGKNSRTIFLQELFDRYGERPVAYATTEEGALLIALQRNFDTGSYSITMSGKHKICMISSGDGWIDEGLPIPEPALIPEMEAEDAT